ncbi:MAG: site-2 protease family protein [Ruminococcus sp.]|nr:site-2 protease family protein [Ruminococcus sp.]
MLTYLIRGISEGNLDFMTIVMDILAALVVIFLVMPFHEWAHAFVAYKLGDKGIKYRGRLTLNPIEHIDPIGALMIIFLGFGWAKPVPIDDRNFKNPKVGMGISALAGPVANLLAAMAGGLIFNALFCFFPQFMMFNKFGEYINVFLSYYIILNVALAVFNLVPIPPLDGSKILFMFLPDRWVANIYKYERFFFIAIIILLWTGVLPVSTVSYQVTNFVIWLTGLPFGI